MRVKLIATGIVLLTLGAILVLVSQVPFERDYYDLVDSESFSAGQPLQFYWTFEGNASYRFEVETSNWTYPSPWIHWMSVSNDTLSLTGARTRDSKDSGIIMPPYVWYWTAGYNTTTLRACWWRFFGENHGQIIETPDKSAHVDLSQLEHETYQLTELAYAGAAMITLGAALVLVTEWKRRDGTR